jgi:hypothetical protein
MFLRILFLDRRHDRNRPVQPAAHPGSGKNNRQQAADNPSDQNKFSFKKPDSALSPKPLLVGFPPGSLGYITPHIRFRSLVYGNDGSALNLVI